MALEHFEKVKRAEGNTAIAEMAKTMREQYGDVPLPATNEQAITSTLVSATEEYKKALTSPEKETLFWQSFWVENGRKVDLKISVTECPWSEAQLKEMAERGKSPIYLPEEVSTQESRNLLGKMFPKMQSHSVKKENSVTNEVTHSGWRQFDMAIDAPHLETNESQLKKAMVVQGDEEPTLNEYIVAGQASKLLTGKYLDEGTWSRILGSRLDGSVVGAFFVSDGRLDVLSFWGSGARDSNLGGRFSRGVN